MLADMSTGTNWMTPRVKRTIRIDGETTESDTESSGCSDSVDEEDRDDDSSDSHNSYSVDEEDRDDDSSDSDESY